MTDVVLVDWLGRGGIAQTSEAFRRILVEGGNTVCVVSRPSDTVLAGVTERRRLPSLPGAVELHRRLLRAAASLLQDRRPDVLYLQNYSVPLMEIALVDAAQRLDVRVVLGLHNDRVHERGAGLDVGLRRLIRRADVVVAHSEFVADRIAARFGREAVLVPHPMQTGVLGTVPAALPEVLAASDGRPLALAFGILGRGYKGSTAIGDIARMSDEWLVVAAGVGASSVEGPGPRVDRFLTESELHWLVARAEVSLLPYTRATQSGAVVLSQALETVPLVSDVGALREQVGGGRSGVVLTSKLDPQEWVERLRWLARSPTLRRELAVAGRTMASDRHAAATLALNGLCAGLTR